MYYSFTLKSINCSHTQVLICSNVRIKHIVDPNLKNEKL